MDDLVDLRSYRVEEEGELELAPEAMSVDLLQAIYRSASLPSPFG
jgi:hypothetical protein